jgi:hypothetical protein
VKLRSLAVVALTLASGCSRPEVAPPAALYRHLGDRLRVYLPFMGQPCGTWWNVAARRRLPVGRCFVFERRVRVSGVLRVEGYGPARFLPGATRLPPPGEGWRNEWRTMSDRYALEERPSSGNAPVALRPRDYVVTIGGRVTAPFGDHYGNTRILLLEGVEAIRRLPNP